MTTIAPPLAPASPPRPVVFGFRIPTLTRLFLLPWGVGVRPTDVTLDDHQIAVRFGWFSTRADLADVLRFEISGPYWWIRAIGVRHSVFRSDISFCTDTRGAVRLFLSAPRPVAFVRRVDNIYLGVEDPDSLAEELRRRGIQGEDRRKSTDRP